jgi:hypothetical protein
MMTRRDFEAIAHVLDANVSPLSLVSDFADLLEEENPRFDRKRFVQASTNRLREIQEHEARMLSLAVGEA